MSDEAESLLKGRKTLTDVRQVVKDHPALKEELQESMGEPVSTLSRSFSSMKLKDEPIKVFNGAPDDDVSNTALY